MLTMFVVSMAAALLSTMNLMADKWTDISITLNDFYMAFVMTGFMFFFEGILIANNMFIAVGICLIFVGFLCIRAQFLITPEQYATGMITHHSVAIFTSKKLMDKYGKKVIFNLPFEIVKKQSEEIGLLKLSLS